MSSSLIASTDGVQLKKATATPAPRNGSHVATPAVRRNPQTLETAATLVGIANLNQILADTLTLRDLYKKHHWQASGPTFYTMHVLFDKHAAAQAELADVLAERVQAMGGTAVAMAADVAGATMIPRAPREREETTAQVTRLLQAHDTVLDQAHLMARVAADGGDLGTNDVFVSDVIRTNELQVWFLAEHLR